MMDVQQVSGIKRKEKEQAKTRTQEAWSVWMTGVAHGGGVLQKREEPFFQ